MADFFQAIISWDGEGVANNIIGFSSNISPTLDMPAGAYTRSQFGSS